MRDPPRKCTGLLIERIQRLATLPEKHSSKGHETPEGITWFCPASLSNFLTPPQRRLRLRRNSPPEENEPKGGVKAILLRAPRIAPADLSEGSYASHVFLRFLSDNLLRRR